MGMDHGHSFRSAKVSSPKSFVVLTRARHNRRYLSLQDRPWDADSSFEGLISDVRDWHDTLTPEIQFTLPNLYARHATHELGALLSMHLWHDHILCYLYKIALPGSAEWTAGSDYFASAPPGWVDGMRRAAFDGAVAIREKICLVERLFPDYVPTNRMLNRVISAAIGVQVDYTRAVGPHGLSEKEKKEMIAGFQSMVNMTGKMTKYFLGDRRIVSHTFFWPASSIAEP